MGQKRQGSVPEIVVAPGEKARLSGPGLHSGRPCAVTLRPAPAGAGWWLGGAPVPTLPVVDTRLATTLGTPSGPVMTVEHLFAALAGLGIADVELTVDGPEIPAMDGSAAPFCAALRALGLPRPGLPRRVVSTGFVMSLGDTRIAVSPAPEFRVSAQTDFPGLGAGAFESDLTDFEVHLAPARTFGSLADAPALRASGRALGASLENCVVFDAAHRPLNPEGLRFPDEPFRHKTLDLLGDLARPGWLPAAHVRVVSGGHGRHAALVERLIASTMQAGS